MRAGLRRPEFGSAGIAAVPPWTLATGSMLAVQLGSALSVPLVAAVGPAGTAWLRLTAGALLLLVLGRPPFRSLRRPDLAPLLALGVTTGLMSVAFLAAIQRIPLGTAVAVEFLGPLTVAALRGGSRRALAWPGLALVGVVLLTEPWTGRVDGLGIGFAALAGVGWAGYILLTQRVGDRFSGIAGLTMTVPVAALTAAVVGIPQALGHLTPGLVLVAIGIAAIHPVLPFALEMLALRRMTHTAFGTLMAVEPAIGVLIGLLMLHQRPSWIQVVGIALVVTAGAAAQRGGAREVSPPSADPGLPAASAATTAR